MHLLSNYKNIKCYKEGMGAMGISGPIETETLSLNKG